MLGFDEKQDLKAAKPAPIAKAPSVASGLVGTGLAGAVHAGAGNAVHAGLVQDAAPPHQAVHESMPGSKDAQPQHIKEMFNLFGSMFGLEWKDAQKSPATAALSAGPSSQGKGHEGEGESLNGATTLYAKGTGDAHDVDINDIKQGQLGDCYFLASVGAVAKQNPDGIKHLLQENRDKDGNVVSYTVKFKEKDTGFLGTGLFSSGYKDIPITVDAKSFPKDGKHANLTGDKNQKGEEEMWPLIMEKAYAQKHGGYDKIGDGGWPADALSELTGKDSEKKTPGKYSAEQIEKDLADGKGISFSTRPTTLWEDVKGLFGRKASLPNDLANSHSYTVTGVQTGEDGKQYVILNNPWGHTQPKPVPIGEVADSFNDIAVNDGGQGAVR